MKYDKLSSVFAVLGMLLILSSSANSTVFPLYPTPIIYYSNDKSVGLIAPNNSRELVVGYTYDFYLFDRNNNTLFVKINDSIIYKTNDTIFMGSFFVNSTRLFFNITSSDNKIIYISIVYNAEIPIFIRISPPPHHTLPQDNLVYFLCACEVFFIFILVKIAYRDCKKKGEK